MNLTKKASQKPQLSPAFTRQTHETLAHKGIKVLHATPLPTVSGEVARGFAVTDNGVYRIWSYSQIMALVN
jgi:hypothetical protein